MRIIVIVPLILLSLFGDVPRSGITFLDIGTGDSTIITIGEETILIDAGPLDNILFEFEKIPKNIDLLVITHMHEDHLSGARYILERYDVEQIILPEICDQSAKKMLYPSAAYLNPAIIIEIDNTELVHIAYPIEHLTIKLFLPRYSPVAQSGCITADDSDEVNDNSIVTEITTSNSKLLMMGDVERSGELFLLNSGMIAGNYSLLKAGHHCSDTSSTEKFLREVDPELIICSTGSSNPYGHPSNEVMERALSLNIKVHITFRDGSLFVPL